MFIKQMLGSCQARSCYWYCRKLLSFEFLILLNISFTHSSLLLVIAHRFISVHFKHTRVNSITVISSLTLSWRWLLEITQRCILLQLLNFDWSMLSHNVIKYHQCVLYVLVVTRYVLNPIVLWISFPNNWFLSPMLIIWWNTNIYIHCSNLCCVGSNR